ncbi:hypothetical protein Tco_1522913 [Tanacetum coccineum]
MHKEAQVTSKEGANSQLSSVISASNLHKPIYSASFIIHSESASGRDASADSTAEADPGNSALYDSLPQQQGRDEGTKTIYLITYLKEREQVRLQKKLKKSALRILNLALLPLLKYSLEDDPNIVVDESKEDDEEVHATHVESEIFSSQTFVSQHKLENEKRQAEAEVALLSAKPSFPNVVYEHVVLASTRHRETATTIRKSA